LYEISKENNYFAVYGLDSDVKKMHENSQKPSKLPKQIDTVHICIPYEDQNEFIKNVVNYAEKFKPKLLIINSTIPPGTTKNIQNQCNCLVAHSPVRGVHKNPEHMKWEMKRWTKYVGGASAKAADATCKHFEKMGLKVKMLNGSAETELAKLFETTYRAWMISCFQEMHRIARTFNADFSEVVDFIEDTHRTRLDRPIMFPGFIGGHCLIQNTKLLLKSYDSKFLRLILESNQKRKKELKDNKLEREAAKVSRRVEALEKELEQKMKERD
jgi:UDP-N-acetyl-D-mannosaminuronate dehydrogenase